MAKMSNSQFGAKMREEFLKVFPEPLNAAQLWAVTKLAKRCRVYARGNTALNNLMEATFPHAKFKQVPKKFPDGTPYEGLSIQVNGEEVSQEENAE